MQAVLELPSPGLLHLGPPLILGHLGPLLAHHLLQVVDLVLELMLLVPMNVKTLLAIVANATFT